MTSSESKNPLLIPARLLTLVLIVAALYFARDVFIPLALGLLLSFLLSPIVSFLSRLRVPNVLAVATTAAISFILLAAGFTLLGTELTKFVTDLPRHKKELISKATAVSGLTRGMGNSFGKLADEVTEAMGENPTPIADIDSQDPRSETADGADESGDPNARSEETAPRNSPAPKSASGDRSTEIDRLPEDRGSVTNPKNSSATDSKRPAWLESLFPQRSFLSEDSTVPGQSTDRPLFVTPVDTDFSIASWASTAGNILGPLATAGLVTVFALFMLVHRDDLRDRVIAVVSNGRYVTTTHALDEVAVRISRYLVAQTIVNVVYGVVLTVGLLIIGSTLTEDGIFPNAVLWGVLAACLRFVPYIGPLASALFPLTIAFAVFPGYSVVIAVLALIVAMEMVSNNIIEPWFYGTSTGISAVAVIVAAVFWGWLWGPVGLILSTPLTVCLVVLGRHVPQFQVFTTLLGEQVSVSPSIRLYQRLLTRDPRRSREYMTEFVDSHGTDRFCDQALVPAMKRIRRDHDSDELDDEAYQSILTQLDSIPTDIGWPSQPETPHSKDDENTVAEGDAPATDAPLPRIVVGASHHVFENLLLRILEATSTSIHETEFVSEDLMPQDFGTLVEQRNPIAVVICVLPKGGFTQARFLCKSIHRSSYKGPVIIATFGKFKKYDRLFVRFRKVGASSMTTSFQQLRAKIASLIERQKLVHQHSDTDVIKA